MVAVSILLNTVLNNVSKFDVDLLMDVINHFGMH